jgi:hypothetical protein
MKNFKIEFKWAIYFSILTLFWLSIEKGVGLHDQHIDLHPIYTNLIAIPYILLYYLALRQKREWFYNGKITWSQAMVSGAVLSAIVALLSPLVQYIGASFITPDYFKNATEYAIEQRNMNPDLAKQYFSMRSYIIQSIFFALAMGIVTSALVALFVKKK